MEILSQKILTTLAYYDAMDYPMTAFEVWKYLISDQEAVNSNQEKKKISLADIVNELDSEDIKKNIEQHHGYYFLHGRKDLVEKRLERNKLAQIKFNIARRVIFWLRFAPFVRMVAVTGRLAMKNTDAKSDLDLLIVLERGHIFTGRALVTFLVHILGKRRHGKKIANRICLNLFISDKSLRINFEELFPNYSRQFVRPIINFSANEYSFIYPIFDLEIFKKFQEANDWIGGIRENQCFEGIINAKHLRDTFLSKSIRKAGEIIFSPDILEKKMKEWQIQRIMRDPRTHIPGNMVMANDDYLVFLPEPQGGEIYEKFMEKITILDLGKKFN